MLLANFQVGDQGKPINSFTQIYVENGCSHGCVYTAVGVGNNIEYCNADVTQWPSERSCEDGQWRDNDASDTGQPDVTVDSES